MADSKRGSIPSMEAAGDALTEETIVVVLGASGDLAKKKTFPALFALFAQDLLPKNIHIVGYARTKMDKDEFHKRETQYIKGDDAKIKEFQEISSYISGAYDEDSGFQELLKHVEELEGDREKPNRVFYMALPPSVFTTVAKGLKKNCYSDKGANRIIIEKPFGKDLESCRQMMSDLKSEWSENETYRIDHYLGKEMIKNMLVLRFGNVFLDASFNKHFVSNVQITFKEPFGTEGRGGYFDEFGIIRDVCQNLLRCIPPIERKDVLLGQYVGNGDKPGYLEDDTVPKGSVCPTFAAMTLWVNNPRWEGVPFIMKAGKDEAVYLKMNSKLPGFVTRAVPTELDLTYKKRFTDFSIPQAYEALILDAFKGDHSNFVRDDELDVAWKIFTPILHWIDGKAGVGRLTSASL
ncbi:glucose-6-phosphate dehydrogenase [Kwoniella newhampshirensis]|uniref:Glucose-6-phosphate 1-dehydrogenase n=1 Tax=Kwoniella newhampshirensis TaxID=1651941 RepID=A0AAW0YMJ0_9TREE